MERIYQMNVVPDMLPELHPSFDLRIRYLAPTPKDNYLRTRVKRKHRQVEPGIFLTPEQVRCGRVHERRRTLKVCGVIIDEEASRNIHDAVPHRHAPVHADDG